MPRPRTLLPLLLVLSTVTLLPAGDEAAESPDALLAAARAASAEGNADGALELLGKLAATGSTAQLRVALTPEFQSLRDDPRFEKVLHELRPCRAPEYRQFDFWLGDWDVTSAGPGGTQRKSHNRISSVQGGCVILEEYDTPAGYTGISISYYDVGRQRWLQSWMDNQGSPIVHVGGLVGGAMVLLDEPDEGQPLNRTTWTPLEDGRVRQHWERSADGGQTWTTVFDGTYQRR